MANGSDNPSWGYLIEIGESERHFNNIQAKYRLLASTWLLASFAGIGFVLKDLGTASEKDLLLFAITAGGSFGVVLIWILDILGYHRLLGAYFLEGLRIEQENPELPQIRHQMLKLGTVGGKVQLFYFICAISPVSMGVVLLLRSSIMKEFNSPPVWKLIGLSVVLMIVFLTKYKTGDPKHQREYKKFLRSHKGT